MQQQVICSQQVICIYMKICSTEKVYRPTDREVGGKDV